VSLFQCKFETVYILSGVCIQTCLDLCDPEGISSRWGMWSISCQVVYFTCFTYLDRLRLKCDGTRAETRFRLSTEQTSPFKSVGASVQSTTGRRDVHISLQGLYCSCKLMFCSHDAYWLPTPFCCFPLTSPPVRHRVPSHFSWTLLLMNYFFYLYLLYFLECICWLI